MTNIADDTLANGPSNEAAINQAAGADVGYVQMNHEDASSNDRELNAGAIERGNMTAATQAAQLAGTILYCNIPSPIN